MKNFIDRNDEVMRLLPAESSKHIAIPSESALQVAKESKKQGLKQNFFFRFAEKPLLKTLTQKLF